MNNANDEQPEPDRWCVCYCGDDGPFLAKLGHYDGQWADNEEEIVDVQLWEYAPTP